MHVLIVEDERFLAREIADFLSSNNYLCDIAFSFKMASDKLSDNQYDFVLLDIGLPDGDGLDVLKYSKKAGYDASYIILTARGELEDRLKGFNLGADDYLPKPFALPELAVRMQAIIRRKSGLKSDVVVLNDLAFDMKNRSLTYNNSEILLTKKEFDILSYLILNKNRILTRLQLADHIWGNVSDSDYDSNYIDVHIKNIRKKITAYTNTDWLKTIRGVGYRVSI